MMLFEKWWPVVAFVGIPSYLFFRIYYPKSTNRRLCFAVFGFLLSVLYVFYVLLERPENAFAILPIFSQELGPIVAIYIARCTGKPPEEIIKQGGDHLVQLAFCVTGVISLIAFIFAKMVGDIDKQQKWVSGVGFLIVVYLLWLSVCHRFDYEGPRKGSTLWGKYNSPDLNGLTQTRFLLGMYAVLLSVQPKG